MVLCKFYLQGSCRYGNKCWNEHSRPQQGGVRQQLNFGQDHDSYSPRGSSGGGYRGGGNRGNQRGNFQNSYNQDRNSYNQDRDGDRDSYNQNRNSYNQDRNSYNQNRNSYNQNHKSYNPNQNPYQWLAGDAKQGGKSNQDAQSVAEMTPQEILPIISGEIQLWNESNMWPLSCFAYGKEVQCYPGFEDHSPDELRYQAYEAQKASNFEAYKQHVAQLIHDSETKKFELRKPDPVSKQKIYDIIEAINSDSRAGNTGGTFGSPSSSFQPVGGATSSSTFGDIQSGSIFGGSSSTQSASLFGAAPATEAGSIFGGNPSTQSGSIFGGNSSTQSGSIFGGTSSTHSGSIFGGTSSTQSGSIFGGTPSTQSGSIFGGTSSTQSGSIFGGTSSTQSGSIFGGTSSTQAGSAFGGTSSTAAPQPSSIFGASQPTQSGSVFGGTPTAPQSTTGTGLFGKGVAPNTGQNSSSNTGLFGKPSSGTPSAFSGSSVAQTQANSDSLYTPLDQLTKEERAQFEAPKFVLGKIPIRPPPRELV